MPKVYIQCHYNNFLTQQQSTALKLKLWIVGQWILGYAQGVKLGQKKAEMNGILENKKDKIR